MTMTTHTTTATGMRPVYGVWYTMRSLPETQGWLGTDGTDRPFSTYDADEADRKAVEFVRLHGESHTYEVREMVAVQDVEDVVAIDPSDMDVVQEMTNLRLEVQRLTTDVQTLATERDAARRETHAAVRATVERIQGVLREMADNENTWDCDAYNDFADSVNGYLNWPFDRYEQDFVVRGTASVTVTFSVPVSTTVTAANGEDAAQNVDWDDLSDEIGEYLRYNLSGTDVYEAWHGDYDDVSVDEVESA